MAINYQKYDVITNMPNIQSPGSAWIAWHKMLRNRFGKKDANRLWLKAWIARAGMGSAASTQDLREYMDGMGVKIERTTLEGLGETVTGIGDFFGDMFTTFKWVTIGGIILGVGGLAFITYKVFKNPSKTAQTIVLATPQGRAATAVKAVAGK